MLNKKITFQNDHVLWFNEKDEVTNALSFYYECHFSSRFLFATSRPISSFFTWRDCYVGFFWLQIWSHAMQQSTQISCYVMIQMDSGSIHPNNKIHRDTLVFVDEMIWYFYFLFAQVILLLLLLLSMWYYDSGIHSTAHSV